MSHCEECERLRQSLFDGTRWVLTHETQTCIWESDTSLPEVAIGEATSFAHFCCEEHAIEGVEQYLLQAGARAQWSDVRPVDTCARCGQDFETARAHQVLVLSTCAIEGEDVQQYDVQHIARFCNNCVP